MRFQEFQKSANLKQRTISLTMTTRLLNEAEEVWEASANIEEARKIADARKKIAETEGENGTRKRYSHFENQKMLFLATKKASQGIVMSFLLKNRFKNNNFMIFSNFLDLNVILELDQRLISQFLNIIFQKNKKDRRFNSSLGFHKLKNFSLQT